MKNPAAIKALIDSQEPYAYALMAREHGYGHMNVRIRLTAPSWSMSSRGAIVVSCQIGGDFGDQSERPYAQRYGFDSDGNEADLATLERATKMMKKIAKYLDKCYEANGNPDTYAEFCHRIVRGSGVKDLITESGDGWNNGGQYVDKDLFAVGGDSRDRLAEMEKNLIQAFSHRAA